MNTDEVPTEKGFPFQLGFGSMQELRELILLVPLRSQEEVDEFQLWKQKDGSKAGLLYILGVYASSDNPERCVYRDMESRDRWFEYLKDKRIREYTEEKKKLDYGLMDDLRKLEVLRIQSQLA